MTHFNYQGLADKTLIKGVKRQNICISLGSKAETLVYQGLTAIALIYQRSTDKIFLITMRKKAKAKIMYKVLNKMASESLTQLFTYKNEITNHKL